MSPSYSARVYASMARPHRIGERRPGRGFVTCLTAVALLGPFAAGAQPQPGTAPSQIAPPSLRPPAEPAALEPVTRPDPSPLIAPAGADTVFVTPSAFTVDDEFPELEAERATLFARVTGTRISVARIFDLANRLEQAYARAGYVLARVVVPPQRVEDSGEVRLRVVDGFVESVDASAVPAAIRARVAAVVGTLVGQRRLTLGDIERKLLIAGDTPGVQLRSTLAAGERDGGTVLVLDGGFRAVTGAAVADNRLSDSLGRWQYGGTLALNSLSGQGDQLYATFRTGSPIGESFTALPRLRIAGVGLAVPVGLDGAVLTGEFTDAQTHAVPAPGTADVTGQLRRVAARGTYPLIRTQAETLLLTGLLEHLQQANRSVLLDADLSRDRYLAIRARLDWSRLTPWGAPMSVGMQLSRGLNGRDESQAMESGISLSRQGAEPTFRRADASLFLSQPMPIDRVRLNLGATVQTTFRHPVFVSEQYLLDGYGMVTGVPSGSLSADRGLSGRVELTRAYPLTGVARSAQLSPYGFLARGVGYLERPTAAEQPRITGRSGGIGARFEMAAGPGRGTHTVAIELARYDTDLRSVPSATRVMLVAYLAF